MFVRLPIETLRFSPGDHEAFNMTIEFHALNGVLFSSDTYILRITEKNFMSNMGLEISQ
jgi:hypothetical protein